MSKKLFSWGPVPSASSEHYSVITLPQSFFFLKKILFFHIRPHLPPFWRKKGGGILMFATTFFSNFPLLFYHQDKTFNPVFGGVHRRLGGTYSSLSKSKLPLDQGGGQGHATSLPHGFPDDQIRTYVFCTWTHHRVPCISMHCARDSFSWKKLCTAALPWAGPCQQQKQENILLWALIFGSSMATLSLKIGHLLPFQTFMVRTCFMRTVVNRAFLWEVFITLIYVLRTNMPRTFCRQKLDVF